MIELRAQQIVIDAPRRDRDPFVAIIVQRIIYNLDNSVKQRINREKVINRALTSVATQLYPYNDPVTGGCTENISGAGLGIAISSAAAQWIIEEYQAENAVLIDGRVILNGGN